MNITFRQMRLFLALADTGSVSGAARALHVTQPTASMQLREVTEAVGLPLYEVIGRRVHLTDAGRDLAATARAIVDAWENFGQRVNAMHGLTRGRLRVAVVSTAKYFVPRLLGGFCAQYPDIEIALEVLNRDGVDFEDTKRFSKAVAEVLAGAEPGLVVARQAKAARRGKVLVDWYQNDRAKTTIGVYSLRARERPTVSTPVTWAEVEACAASGDPDALVFTAADVVRRVADQGDLFGDVLALTQALPAG